MTSKPSYLGTHYAEQFKEKSVVAAYEHRPPIPEAIFDVLLQLIADKPKTVLDAGCGTGAVARCLAPFVDRVDAIDFSAAMVDIGKSLPEGDYPNLHWTVGSLEETSLEAPYALIVAAGSLHWMDWDIVMPRFQQALTPAGMLAIVWQEEKRQPWSSELGSLISRYSTNQDYQPFNLIKKLTQHGYFHQHGERQTPAVPFAQSIASYVESIHSRNGFSRDRMEASAAAAFDEAVTKLLAPFYPDESVSLEIVGHVVWGKPAARSA